MIQPENREINRFRRKQFNNFSQITIPYLAAYVDTTRFEITIIDEYAQRVPFHKDFDLVAITVNTPNALRSYEISAQFRSNGASVVMGGPHASLLSDEVKCHCDFLIKGEAEATWPQFLNDFFNGNPKPIYESNIVPTLNSLPMPRWDLLRRFPLMKGAVFATRGCPYACRYCNLKQIYHDCFRMRPIDEVVKEVGAMSSRFFVFWDDNFFADADYAKALLKRIAPLKRRWAAQASLKDCADKELLRLAKAAGCLYLFIGIESFSTDSLNDAGKAINRVQDYKPLIDAIHQNGIMVQAGIVFGFDSDRPDVFNKTLESCEALGIDGATISILTPFPKTPIYEQFKREGRLLSENWTLYNSKTAVTFKPVHMSEKELFSGYLWFRKHFYSLASFIRRMRISKTNTLLNFFINLGYWLSIKS
jgi:radical SAM superfamily enzyme YgiQ (UPF0313 family)